MCYYTNRKRERKEKQNVYKNVRRIWMEQRRDGNLPVNVVQRRRRESNGLCGKRSQEQINGSKNFRFLL